MAVKLEDRTLTVSVADAIWQKQLTSMRGQLLVSIKSSGKPLVGALDFIVDPAIANDTTSRTRAHNGTGEGASSITEVPLELWSAANAIHDKERAGNS